MLTAYQNRNCLASPRWPGSARPRRGNRKRGNAFCVYWGRRGKRRAVLPCGWPRRRGSHGSGAAGEACRDLPASVVRGRRQGWWTAGPRRSRVLRLCRGRPRRVLTNASARSAAAHGMSHPRSYYEPRPNILWRKTALADDGRIRGHKPRGREKGGGGASVIPRADGAPCPPRQGRGRPRRWVPAIGRCPWCIPPCRLRLRQRCDSRDGYWRFRRRRRASPRR